MTSKTAILASPMLCLGVLTVIAADNARHVRPDDAEPYHARAKTAIDAFPYVIDNGSGPATTNRCPMPPSNCCAPMPW